MKTTKQQLVVLNEHGQEMVKLVMHDAPVINVLEEMILAFRHSKGGVKRDMSGNHFVVVDKEELQAMKNFTIKFNTYG